MRRKAFGALTSLLVIAVAYLQLGMASCDKTPTVSAPALSSVWLSASEEAFLIEPPRGFLGSTNRPRIKGQAPSNSTVHLYLGSKCEGAPFPAVSANDFATLGVVAMVSQRSLTMFSAIAENSDGYRSQCSTQIVSYLHDPDAPALPSQLVTEPSVASNNAYPKIKGTIEPNGRVEIYVNSSTCGGTPVRAGADEDGYFEARVEVTRNSVSRIFVRVFDLAENGSLCGPSGGVSYEHDSNVELTLVDTTPPSPSNNPSPTLNGLAEAGTNIWLYDTADCSGNPIGSGMSDGTGRFSIPFAPRLPATGTQGVVTTTIKAKAQDAVGNLINCAKPSVSYTFDNAPPMAPILSGTLPSGSSSDETPLVYGTGVEPNSFIELFRGAPGDPLCSGMPLNSPTLGNADGSFSVAVTVPENSTSVLSARVRDRAGNSSPCSNGLVYLEDSTAEPIVFISPTIPESPSNQASFRVFGLIEPNSSIALYSSSSCEASTIVGSGSTADLAGSGVLVTLPNDLLNQTVSIHGIVTDEFNNVSTCSTNSLVYIHDSTPPDAPILFLASSLGNNNSVLVNGNGPNELHPGYAEIFKTNNCTGPVATSVPITANPTGFDFSAVITVPDNSVTSFSARHIDAAGNPSACGASLSAYREDSLAPITPQLLGLLPASPSTTGHITASVYQPDVARFFGEFYRVRLTGSGGPCTSSAYFAGQSAPLTQPVLLSVAGDLGLFGVYRVRAFTIDGAGNSSACSNEEFEFIYEPELMP